MGLFFCSQFVEPAQHFLGPPASAPGNHQQREPVAELGREVFPARDKGDVVFADFDRSDAEREVAPFEPGQPLAQQRRPFITGSAGKFLRQRNDGCR